MIFSILYCCTTLLTLRCYVCRKFVLSTYATFPSPFCASYQIKQTWRSRSTSYNRRPFAPSTFAYLSNVPLEIAFSNKAQHFRLFLKKIYKSSPCIAQWAQTALKSLVFKNVRQFLNVSNFKAGISFAFSKLRLKKFFSAFQNTL